MELTVNDKVRRLAPGTTLADLLGDRTKGVVVAVNEEVAPRSTWPVAVLRDGDRVEILEAHQGG